MEKYYDYDNVPLIEKEGKLYRYGKNAELVEFDYKPNSSNLHELSKEVFEKWIKEGHYEIHSHDFNKQAPHIF